jgi:hypothetical protein
MDPRHVEASAEFCRKVGKADLLDYLGLPRASSVEDAQEALKKKRRYMQGMQANPKYKAEAVAFIKAFGSFVEVLAAPADYLAATQALGERSQVAIVEATIRSALQGGTPSAAQFAWLERNAGELGIGGTAFRELYDRLLAEAGPVAAPADPWTVLGVSRSASMAEMEDAWRDMRVTADSARIVQLDRAWAAIQAASAPEPAPGLSGRVEPPPSAGVPTAPPVRERSFGPGRSGSYSPVPASHRAGPRVEDGPTSEVERPDARSAALPVGGAPLGSASGAFFTPFVLGVVVSVVIVLVVALLVLVTFGLLR